MRHSAFWSHYWAVWLIAFAVTGAGAELYTLMTNTANTLSDNLWRFERFLPGQPITGWTFAHFAITFGLALSAVWLVGHFGWGLWR